MDEGWGLFVVVDNVSMRVVNFINSKKIEFRTVRFRHKKKEKKVTDSATRFHQPCASEVLSEYYRSGPGYNRRQNIINFVTVSTENTRRLIALIHNESIIRGWGGGAFRRESFRVTSKNVRRRVQTKRLFDSVTQ